MRLTKRTAEAIEPAARDVLAWDAEVPGFRVKVTPKGAGTHILQYSRRDRSRRLTIGRHGDLMADQARKRAEALCGVIAAGGDPAAERAHRRATPTMRALAERRREFAAGCERHGIAPMIARCEALAADRGDARRNRRPADPHGRGSGDAA